MSATWNYAELSKTAKVMGGPELYIAAIKRASYMRGLLRGSLGGALMGAGATVLGAVGVARYREVRAEAIAAEAALLESTTNEKEPPVE